MVEVIVPADSQFVGQSAVSARMRQRFGLTVIGLRRGVQAVESGLRDEQLQIGDTLLMIGPWQAILNVQASGRDLVPLSLPAEHDDVLPVAGKALQAVSCLGLVVALMITGLLPNVQAALIGCLLMGALGVVNLESAYRSIDWKTIVLIVGMLPFSTALQRTGGVELASDALMALAGGLGPQAILATLFVLTALLGMFISNTATAVLMAPIALAVADELQASPYPFAMIVALAASTAFMTPVSSPVNTLVVTPGGYRFGDFVRIGVPFSLIVLVVSVFMVPWLLPL
jgi:di/tricarboxylate transporter